MRRIVLKFGNQMVMILENKGRVRLEQDLRKMEKHPFNLCIQRLDHVDK